jgi:hypothetical protein
VLFRQLTILALRLRACPDKTDQGTLHRSAASGRSPE